MATQEIPEIVHEQEVIQEIKEIQAQVIPVREHLIKLKKMW